MMPSKGIVSYLDTKNRPGAGTPERQSGKRFTDQLFRFNFTK